MKRTSIKNLIFEFFLHFSTFEYALKENGYLMNFNKTNPDAFPDWSKYLSEVKIKLPKTIDLVKGNDKKNALNYLINSPPKKQIIRNGVLEYSQEIEMDEGNLDWSKIIIYIKRIRNNLFHGEKEPFHSKRDVDLLEAALILLPYLASMDNELKEIYINRVTRIHSVC